MKLVDMLWAKQGDYDACGMFTKQHGIILILCLFVLLGLLIASKNMNRTTTITLVKVTAILMVLLEIIKIAYNFYYGYTWLDAWLPIAFCSIFIYALIFSAFTSGKLKKMGDAYLSGASIVAGVAYLLFPSTSLMLYPAFHYLSLHSMLFHTMMIYIGVLLLWKLDSPLNWQSYYDYVVLFMVFTVIAVVLNTVYNSNLMMLREPFHLPVPILYKLYAIVPWGYTMFVILVYLIIPYALTYGICQGIMRCKQGAER